MPTVVKLAVFLHRRANEICQVSTFSVCTTGYRKISNHMLPSYSDWVSQGCNLSYSYEYDPTSNDLTSCIQYCSSTADCKGFVIHVHEYGEDEYSYYGDHSGCWFTSCDSFSPGYFYYYDDSMDTFLKDDECYAGKHNDNYYENSVGRPGFKYVQRGLAKINV